MTVSEYLDTASAIGVVSAGLGAVGYAVLAGLLALAGRAEIQGRLLFAAALLSAIWLASVALILPIPEASSWQALVVVFECLRSAAWLLFLSSLLPRTSTTPWRLPRYAYVAAAGLSVLVLLFPLHYVGPGGRLLFFLLLLTALGGLVLLEQVLRNTPASGWWGIKFFAIALAALFGYDFFLYAQAVLLRHLDVQLWLARGAVNACLAPLFALAVRRNPEWRLKIYLSREVVFHSSTLLAAGFYLLSMGLAGYWVREVGGTWGQFLQTTFWFAGLVTMTLAFTSGELRSRLRVLLAKHFYRNKYEYRTEWLKLTHTLAGAPLDVRGMVESVVDGVSSLIEAQGAALWLRDEAGIYRLELRRGLSLGAAPQFDLAEDHPLPVFLNRMGWVIILDEWRDDPTRYVGLALPQWLLASSDASLVVPLMARDNLVGFLVLGRTLGQRRFDWEDIDLLKAVGRQTASHLTLALATDALTRSRQFEAYHRLSAFLVHDLKNVVAQLSLLSRNAERHADNPEFVRDAFETVDHAVARMNKMLAGLRSGSAQPHPKALSPVRLDALVEATLARLPHREPTPSFAASSEELWVLADKEPLASAIEHLVQNAQDATPVSGEVKVQIRIEGGEAVLIVADNGVGMDIDFLRHRLFKPFDTTKGNAGMGIGAFESREHIQSMGGRLDVSSQPGQGTEFRIWLPLYQPPSDAAPSPP